MKRFTFGLILIIVMGCLSTAVSQTPDKQVLQSAGESVIDMLVAKDFRGVAKRVNSEFTGSLSEAKLRAGWEDLLAHAGSFKRRAGTTVGKGPGGYDEVIITCEFEKVSIPAHVLFDREMKIVGLWIKTTDPTGGTPQLPSSNQDEAKALATKALAKEVVDIIVAQNITGLRERFNGQMKEGLSEQKIREIWAAVLQNVGAFRKQVNSLYANMDGLDVVAVKCQFERGFVEIRIAFDSEKKIAGLYFLPAS